VTTAFAFERTVNKYPLEGEHPKPTNANSNQTTTKGSNASLILSLFFLFVQLSIFHQDCFQFLEFCSMMNKGESVHLT